MSALASVAALSTRQKIRLVRIAFPNPYWSCIIGYHRPQTAYPEHNHPAGAIPRLYRFSSIRSRPSPSKSDLSNSARQMDQEPGLGLPACKVF